DELRDFGVFFAQAPEPFFVSLNLRQIHVQLGDADLTTLRGNKKQGALGKVIGLAVDLEVPTLFAGSFPPPGNLLALGRRKSTPAVGSEQARLAAAFAGSIAIPPDHEGESPSRALIVHGGLTDGR